MVKKKRSKTDGLSKAELRLIAMLLSPDPEMDTSSTHWKIPATDENKDILVAMYEWNQHDHHDHKEEIQEVLESKDEIEFAVSFLADYLADRCYKVLSRYED